VAEGFELGLHVHFFEEAAFGVGVVGDEEVDVAVGVEVVAEDGAEEGEFGDVPALAKCGEGFGGHIEALVELGVELESGHDGAPTGSLLVPGLISLRREIIRCLGNFNFNLGH
jgi:hypothetical protein